MHNIDSFQGVGVITPKILEQPRYQQWRFLFFQNEYFMVFVESYATHVNDMFLETNI